MTQRPVLENLSWIAGIASAVIAAVVWVKPNASSPADAPAPVPAAAAAPSQQSAAAQKNENLAVGDERLQPKARWSCDRVADDLQPAMNAAKKIAYLGNRDQAYKSIARKALCLEKYELFEQIAAQISYSGSRDEAFIDGVDFALGVRKFEVAHRFSEQIMFSGSRDVARARIVAKSSER
jgi:hypothetical protein